MEDFGEVTQNLARKGLEIEQELGLRQPVSKAYYKQAFEFSYLDWYRKTTAKKSPAPMTQGQLDGLLRGQLTPYTASQPASPFDVVLRNERLVIVEGLSPDDPLMAAKKRAAVRGRVMGLEAGEIAEAARAEVAASRAEAMVVSRAEAMAGSRAEVMAVRSARRPVGVGGAAGGILTLVMLFVPMSFGWMLFLSVVSRCLDG